MNDDFRTEFLRASGYPEDLLNIPQDPDEVMALLRDTHSALGNAVEARLNEGGSDEQ